MRAAVLARPRLVAACLVAVLATVASPVLRSFAGALAAITPAGASAGLSVQITGTGFDAAAAGNDVSFQPAGGAAVISVPSAIAVVDPAKGVRRLTVKVPAGLPTGPAAVTVTNKSTQEAIGGLALDIVTLSLPEAVAGERGATNLRVRILGSSNSRFGTGSRANFGTGITVVSTTVESATSAVATISITAAAALGPRAVSMISTTQNATQDGAFTVTVDPPPPPANLAPTVSAGSNQTITLPASATLSGAASDDGLPGGALTVLWTRQSGPGNVVFANAQSAATSATFSEPGAYTLRLTANDGEKSAFAEVTIGVNAPPNTAPIVNAGSDRTLTLPDTLPLTGTANDDGRPAASVLSFVWSKDSGPGTVTFTPANALSTTATFSQAGTYLLRLTASDGDKSAFDEVSVVVSPPTNLAPTVNAGSDQTVTYPAPVAVTATASDDGLPSGSSLAYAWSKTGGAGTATIATPNAASTSVTFSAAGTYVLRVTVTDGDKSAFDEVSVVVNPPTVENLAPTVNAGSDQTVTYPAPAAVTATASDDGLPTGSSLAYAWSKTGGAGTATIATPNAASTSVTFSAAGTYVLRVTVTDGDKSAFDEVTVVVNPPTVENLAPTVNAGSDQTVTYPTAATVTATASDDGLPTGSSLAYAWSKTGGAGTATIATPNAASTSVTFSAAGTYVLRVTVTDGDKSAFDEVTVVVNPPTVENLAPTVNAGSDQTVTYPTAATVTATASDDGLPTGSSLAYAWSKTGGAGTATIATPNAASTSVTFSAAGTYVLRVTVTDGDKSAFDEVTVVVNPPTVENLAPTVNAGTDQTVTYPTAATVTATASDDGLPTGSSLAYAWSKTGGAGTATIATPNAASTSVTFSAAGTYVLRVTVTDGDKSAFDEVTVVVNPPTNLAPTVNAGADQTVTLPSLATLTGTVSDDGLPITGTLTQVWSKFSGPGAVTFGSASATTTTATFSIAGSYVLRLTAQDGEHTVFDDITIAVNPPTVANVAPSVDAGPDRSVTLPAPAVLGGVVNDDGKPTSAVTISWRKVEGPGDVTFTPPNMAATSAAFTLPGSYTLELKGDDGALFNVDTVIVSVAAPTATNAAPSVDAGADQQVERAAGATLVGTVGDDGKPTAPLQLLWRKVIGPGQVGFGAAGSASTHATFTAPGVYVLSLTASDGELATTDDLAVTVAETATDADRAPPVIELSAPKEALPGAVVELRAQASDNVGVASVRFEVAGAPTEEKTAQPFTRQFTVPELADPGSVIEVRATAYDAAGNSGQAAAVVRISVVPDTENPTVRLMAPTGAAAGGAVVLVADATDNVGVAGVTFIVDGQEVGSDADAPYETSYLVPADRNTATPLLAVARARDFAGNTAESPRSIVVSASTNTDTTPPQIDLTAPAQAAPGSTIALSAVASDASGIAKVEFHIGNVEVGTAIEAPYAAEYVVPQLALAGSSIEVTAEATDFAGLKNTATRSVLVVATDTQAEAAVTGEVYDDTTSLPIAGASVTLVGTDNVGSPYTAAAATDAHGRYLLRGPAGHGVVVVQRTGWTRIDRPVTLIGGQAIEVLDARLTPFRSPAQTVSPVLGATLGQGDARLVLPAGGLAQATPLQITKVGQQGSQGRIPRGWSPVGGADVVPHGTTFASAATLRINDAFGIAAGTTLVAARWDEDASEWRAIGAATIGAGVLEATVDRAGHFVFLVPDTQPLAPAVPSEGAALQGVAAAALPPSLTTAINPQPQILFYRPGAFSEVRGQTTAPSAVSSGAQLAARLSESYTFYSGGVARPAPFVEDLIVFQIGAAASSLAASFAVTPSLEFEPISLERGVIAVELFAQSGDAVSVPLVGSGGGTIDGPSGTSLRIPLGAVANSAPIALANLESTDFGTMPAGLTFVQGIQVTLADALARGASLTIPKPASVTDAIGLLLVRLENIAGTTRLVLAGVVRVEGNQLVSDTIVGGQQTALSGVREAGRYAFVRADAPLGFAGGLVKGVDAAAFAGALVTSAGFGVVSLSNPAGAYLAAAPAGVVSLAATDLVKSDVGTASTFLTTAALLPVTLQLVAQPPRVTALSPGDGTKNVPLASPIAVTFSEAIDPLSVAGANLANILLAGADGVRLEGAASLSQGNRVLTFRPVDALQPNAAYTVTLGVGIKDLSGYGLTAPVIARFDSLDTTPPAPLPAGALSASIPNAQGLSTVSGTQGSAAPTDRVFVDNLTKQTVAVALVQPNGSFNTSILAGITDKLRVRIVDAAGNETIAELGVFKQTNADGSLSQAVSAEGGIVQGPNGVQATIKPGTFPSGAVVTLKDMTASQFPVQFTPKQAETFTVNGGLSIDFGGEKPQLYVDVSLPPAGGEAATDQWVVARLAMLNGIQVFDVVDTGKFRNGRITTASPPCPGVTAAGAYGFIKSRQQIGVNYAQAMPNGGEFAAKMFSQIGLFFAQQAMFGTIEELLNATGGVGRIISDALLPEVDLPLVNILTDLEQTERQKPCFPVLTGDVTVSPNTARIKVSGEDLTPADRQIIVTNTTSGEERQFPHDIPELRFLVPGTPSDDFKVTLRGFGSIASGGEAPKKTLSSFDAVAVDPATVAIRINPDEVDIPTKTVEVLNIKKEKLTTFPIEQTAFEGGVPGSVSDTFLVSVVNAKGVKRGVPAETIAPPFGPGNLLARARLGTIDPTREEMNALHLQGPARTKVHIVNDKGLTLEIPADSIVQGGFAHAFNGDGEAKYSIVVFYDSRPPYSIGIPNFRVEVTNTRTGKVLKTLKSQSPPRDEPLQLPDIENDDTLPIVTAGPTQPNSFDPSGLLQFTFSEAMDPTSVKKNFTVLDKDGAVVAGEVRVSGGNRVATFVPRFALRAGETYTVMLTGGEGAPDEPPQGGMQDRGGNSIVTMRLKIKTFTPTVVGHYDSPAPLKDVALRREKIEPVSGTPFTRTTLFVAAGGDGQNLVVLDATDVRQPRVVSSGSAQASRQKIALLPELSFMSRNGTPFTGDLAVVTRFNVNSSSIDFVDVTQPGLPTNIGGKVLTINPDLALPGYERNSTMFAQGFAKGVAALPVGGGAVAYAAVERVGIMATDVANNTPTRPQGQRVLEGVFACDAMDVATWNGTVAGLCRDGNRLLTFEPGLGVLGQVVLPYTPRKIRIVENLPTDVNGDGVITASEVLDLAIVGGDNGISVVDVRNASAPVVVNAFSFSGVVRDLDVDNERRRIFAGVDLNDDGPSLVMLDLSDPTGQLSASQSFEQRLLWKKSYPAGFNGLRLDSARGVAYVVSPAGLDIYAMYDTCCDLRVEMTAAPEIENDNGERDNLLRAEQAALQQGIAAGLKKAQAVCGLNPDWIRIFESGSSACIWDPDPAKTCTKNYQPGVSDHDLSAFFSNEAYASKLTRPDEFIPDEPPVTNTDGLSQACTPTLSFGINEWSMAVCTIQMLDDQFTDKDKKPIKFDINGIEVKFDDISFIPNSLPKNFDAKYDLCPTDPNIPGDNVNDMALGRQLLVLKHVTEARWINVPGWDGTAHDSQGRSQQLAGQDIEVTFTKLRANGVPLAEGYEWANLMEWNFVKSASLIRIPGAADETSIFHHDFIKQLHTGGKAGIRAAGARMVADPQANARFLALTRNSLTPGDPYSISMEGNACLFAMPDVDSQYWPNKPCDSLEEYIASAAARTRRPWKDQPPLNIFSEADVNMIHRFYRVKSDQEIITDDFAASQFAAGVIRFVMRVQQETKPAYEAYLNGPTISADERTQRIYNMNLKAKELEIVFKKPELHVVPRVANTAFTNANGVLVKMYSNGAPATYKNKKGVVKTLEMRVDLSGGDRLHLEFERDANGFETRDGKGKRTKFFMLPVDQSKNIHVPQTASFTLDLPDRSVREADRQDNVGGFFYWIMDKDNPDPTPPPMNDAMLIPPPVAALLEGDASCTAQPELLITQSMTVNEKTFEGPPAVLGIGQSATLHITVKNAALDAAEEAQACSSATSKCYPLGTLAPGAQQTIHLPFLSREQIIIDAVPTAWAVNRAIATGEQFRIVVACEPYAIVPFSPDPNPVADKSTIMAGGTALRHFLVIDRSTGNPFVGATVKALIRYGNGQQITKIFTTDDEGAIGTRDGDTFIAGVAVPSGTFAGQIEVEIQSVNDNPVACNAAPKRFTVDVKPLTFTEAVKGGASISGEFSLLGGTAKLGTGAGLSLALSGERQPSSATSYSKLTLGRTANVNAKLSIKKDLFDVGLRAGARFELSGPRAEAGVEVSLTSGEKYAFANATVEGNEKKGLGGLIFGGLLEDNAYTDNAFYRGAMEKLNRFGGIDVPTIESLKVSESAGFAVVGSASLSGLRASAGLGTGEEQYVGDAVLAFDAGLNGKAGISFNIESLIKDQKLKADMGLNGEFGISAGLNAGFITQASKIDAEESSSYVRKVKKDTLRKEQDRLKVGGDIAAGIKFSATLDPARDFKADRLDITLSGKKNFGLKVNYAQNPKDFLNVGEGKQYAVTYSTTVDELITKGLRNLPSLNVLMPDNQKQGALPDGGALLSAALNANGPTSVWEDLMEFLADVMSQGTFTRNDDHGISVPLSFGFKAKVLGTGVDFESKFTFDHSVSWLGQRGMMIGGRSFALEDYSDVNLPLSGSADLIGNIASVVTGTADELSPFYKKSTQKTPAPGNKTAMVNDNAGLYLDQADAGPVAGIISYTFTPLAGPVAPAPYDPASTEGRDNRPHYGVGGFHAMEPGGLALSAPAEIRLAYTAADVQGMDESTLRIYRWSDERADWDLIGGTLDTTNHVVTANITKLGTFTLGPRLPAGRITWTVTNVSAAGSNTRVRLRSAPITNNDGTPIAAGSLIHVSVTPPGSPVPLGSVITADANASLEGHQVAVGADGTVEVEVEVLGPPGVVTLVAFSDAGTALSTETITVPQP